MRAQDEASASVVDVEAVMEAVRRRVAEKKARGVYHVDELFFEQADDGSPWEAERIEAAQDAGLLEQHLVVERSDKPIVGRLVTLTKRFIVRAGAHNVANLAHQQTQFNGHIVGYANSLGVEVAALRRDLDELRDHHVLETRLDEMHERIARIERIAADERLGRLELAGEANSPSTNAPPPASAPAHRHAVDRTTGPAARLDHLRLDAVLRPPEADLAGLLDDAALQVGCGEGSLLDLLPAGSRGVEAAADLAERGRAAGRDVVHADPVAYVAALGAASLGAVVVTELLERLDDDALASLFASLERVLRPEGTAVVVVRNPACAEEMSDGFWRDPRRHRPIAPEAIRLLLEVAGLREATLHWRELGEGAGDESQPLARVARSCAVVARR